MLRAIDMLSRIQRCERSVTARSLSHALSTISADVIVIGGGHAGCEAAAASARTGADTVLVTQRLDTIGELSCNPSMGGIGKGHLVREIDALDGLMGKMADSCGIHFKVLNQRKGPAVRGPRAQLDRDLYKVEMLATLQAYPNLRLVEASVEDIQLSGYSDGEEPQHDRVTVTGVVTKEGGVIHANRVVITTGTFLRGTIYLGRESFPAGRQLRNSDGVEPPSVGLALTLETLKFPLGRLKTGTPPRLRYDSIHWNMLEKHWSDTPPKPFSHMNADIGVKLSDQLISCAMTYTNAETHALVQKYSHLLPTYQGGEGGGVGPRYCPSLHAKVDRFPDRDRHIVWLEPEGLTSDLVYPQGMSGPFPLEIQEKIIRSVEGLENAVLVKPGYDIEYDYVDPRSLFRTLETKKVGGLYLAGQICGTTGYEEAGAQGIVAGANAGLAAQNKPALIVGRDEGYIGVLIDDLVSKGATEPYRMFTSRSEYRLSLRADNADIRLTEKGYEYGIVSEKRLQNVLLRKKEIEKALFVLNSSKFLPRVWSTLGEKFKMRYGDGSYKSAADVLARSEFTLEDLEWAVGKLTMIKETKTVDGGDISVSYDSTVVDVKPFKVPHFVRDTVEAICKYSHYLRRQETEMERWRKYELLPFPTDVAYTRELFQSCSNEELELLGKYRPANLHEAAAIQGITAHTLAYLYNKMNRGNRSHEGRTKKDVVD